jgi:hypothetical protein
MTVNPCTGFNARFSIKVLTQISLRHHRPNTSGDWGPQAELVDQSLPAYTPVPSNPSFMGAFVPTSGMAASFQERLRA